MLNNIFGLANRFESEPVLVSEGYARRFLLDIQSAENYMQKPEIRELMQAQLGQGNFWPDDEDDSPQARNLRTLRPYSVKNGVLEIPVKGTLLSRFPYQLFGWATGYTYIEKTFERGMADESVKGIVFVIDSGGGEVRDLFDLTDKIKTYKGQKPIKAISADAAYSAAYALASTADEIQVTRSGGTGSVGVVTMHLDVSKAMSDAGYKITYIHAGKHKVDGNPFEPLAEGVQDRIQRRINKTYSLFVKTVAENRNLSTEDVRATEALTYDAEDSLSVGFADKIGKLEDGLAEFSASLKTNLGVDEMSDTIKDDKAVNQAALDSAVATARAEAHAEGVQAERQRIAAILGSEEAKGRSEAALEMATGTDLTVEQATSLLAKLPTATEDTAKNFDKAMDESNPELNADAGEQETAEADPIDAIFSNYSAQTGIGAKKTQ